MRIVHLATTDFGGAFKATMRINESLQKQGTESSILIRTRFYDTNTIEVMDTITKKILSKVRNGFNLLFSHGEVISDLFGADVSRNPLIKEADVIFLHWVNSFISVGSIRKLLKLGKPIIWVMHDMWVFTGGCHCDRYCGRYELGCGECPLMESKNKFDRSYKNMKQKMQLFQKANITFVALSNWELSCGERSSALKGKEIVRIPNPLDINIFRPMNRMALQKEIFRNKKKMILFGADKALEDRNKGFVYLVEALKYLDWEKYWVVCFGNVERKEKYIPGNMEVIYIGRITEEEELAKWYNLADVFVAPSLQESFGYTVCEALACGTPVAAFAVGGILDQVQHKSNGYLARFKDSKDLATGIEYCIENRDKLTQNARRGVIQKNQYDVVGRKYFDLCKDLLRTYNDIKN